MSSAWDIHPKVVASSVAGAAALVIVWLLSLAHVVVPSEVSGALVVLLTVAAGYLAPSK